MKHTWCHICYAPPPQHGLQHGLSLHSLFGKFRDTDLFWDLRIYPLCSHCSCSASLLTSKMNFISELLIHFTGKWNISSLSFTCAFYTLSCIYFTLEEDNLSWCLVGSWPWVASCLSSCLSQDWAPLRQPQKFLWRCKIDHLAGEDSCPIRKWTI